MQAAWSDMHVHKYPKLACKVIAIDL
jgi:hypothetical protein